MSYGRSNNAESSDEEFICKRRKNSDDLELEANLIAKVGDKIDRSTGSSLESNLDGLCTLLEAHMASQKEKIFKIIIKCIKDMPQKTSIYATLIGLINIKNYSECGDFIDMVMKELKSSIIHHRFNQAITLLRYISDLVNCRVVMPSSLIDLYNSIYETAIEDSSANKLRSDWLIKSILSCLPWSGKELSLKKRLEFDKLLNNIENYINCREKIDLSVYSVWPYDQSGKIDNLTLLWQQIQDILKSRWEEIIIIRPYNLFDTLLRDALQHTLPTMHIPISLSNQDNNLFPVKHFPLPFVMFRLFDPIDLPEELPKLPKHDSIDRFVLDEVISSTIISYNHDKKNCADSLINLEFGLKVPLNYLIVEVILGQLFFPPFPLHLPLFYGSLFIELCKLEHSAFPQVLAQAVVILYDKLSSMNPICIERFSGWFSYHLSNFQFKWSWEEWLEVAKGNPDHPHTRFIREALSQCLRLSYYQRILEVVPSNLEKLIPPKPLPVYLYDQNNNNNDKLEGMEEAEKLSELLKNKPSGEQIQNFLNNINDELLRIKIFIQVLLNMSSKILSFTNAAIAKYQSVLRWLVESKNKNEVTEKQVKLLSTLHSFWKNKPQMIVIIIDKLVKSKILAGNSVIQWAFTPEMLPLITRRYMGKVLDNLINMNYYQIKNHIIIINRLNKKKNKKKLEFEDEMNEDEKIKDDKDEEEEGEEEEEEEEDEEEEEEEDDDIKKKKKNFTLIELNDLIYNEEITLSQKIKNIKIIQTSIIKNLVNSLHEYVNEFGGGVKILQEEEEEEEEEEDVENKNKKFNKYWYKAALARVEEFLFKNPEYSCRYIEYLNGSVFTADVHHSILKIFNSFIHTFS